MIPILIPDDTSIHKDQFMDVLIDIVDIFQ